MEEWLQQCVRRIRREFPLIKAAPYSFIGAVLAAAAIVWFGLHLWYSEEMELQQKRIDQFKDDIQRKDSLLSDYKSKIGHAGLLDMPDTRRMTASQMSLLAVGLGHIEGEKVILIIANADNESIGYSAQIASLFKAAGWKVHGTTALEEINDLSIHVLVGDERLGNKIRDAFYDAGLNVDMHQHVRLTDSASNIDAVAELYVGKAPDAKN